MLKKECCYCGKKKWLGFYIRKRLLWNDRVLHFCNNECVEKYVKARGITWKQFESIFNSAPNN